MHRLPRAFARCLIRTAACAVVAVAAPEASAIRVYFMGNSLTANNNVPGLIQQMRTAAGYPGDFVYDAHILAGLGLSDHWASSAAHTRLASGNWDLVVLQDLSVNPTDNPNSTRTYARLWDAEINSTNPNATTMLYSVWERTDRPNSQAQIDSVYGGLATEFGGVMVPAGDAFLIAKAQRPGLGLYLDSIHATFGGSYLSAAVFYSKIFGQSPVGLAPPPGLSASDALFFQQVAWQSVGGFAPRTLSADFSIGTWDVPQNWSDQRVPTYGDAVRLDAASSQFRSVDYIPPTTTSVQPLASLKIEAAEGGQFNFTHSQYPLDVMGEVSVAGAGGGAGSYNLSGTASLSAASLRIGEGGYGNFQHSGGTANIAGAVTISPPSPYSANYSITAGVLNAQSMTISDRAWFSQSGGSIDISGNLQVNGACVHLSGGTLKAGQIALAAGADVHVSFGANSVVRTASLSIAPDSLLDLGHGLLIIDGSAATRTTLHAQLSQMLAAARNAPEGLWAGKGLTSALAHGDWQRITGLALMLNDNGAGGPIWGSIAGQSVDASDLIVRYTYAGDLNLDGQVDIDDYFLIDTGYVRQRSGYQNGDINYDGSIDSDDYFLIDRAMLGQYGSLSPAWQSPSPVPEPTALTLLLGAGAMALRRRR